MDLSKNYKFVSLIRPQVATSTVTGTGVDTMGYGDDAIITLDLGAALTTTETCDVTIQTSPDNSTWTTRTTFGQLTGTSDNKAAAGKLALDAASRRYVRAVATIAGGSPSFAIAVGMLIQAEQGGASLNSLTAA
jgi:hypothetical protein